MSRVFVTGGTGFIGRRLVAALTECGHAVTVLTRGRDGAGVGLPAGASTIPGSLLEPGDWTRAAQSAEIVFHLAQPQTFGGKITRERALAYRRERLIMDRNLLAPLSPRAVQRIVYVGGTSYYGDLGRRLADESAIPRPRGWGPFIAPAITEIRQHLDRGLPIVTTFPGYVYGFGSWFRQYVLAPLRRQRPLFVLRGRSRMCSPVHVCDCARALSFLMEKGEVGERYFLVDDRPVPTAEIYRLAAECLGMPLHLRRLPVPIALAVIGRLSVSAMRSDAVLSNLRLRQLGFVPAFPSVYSGIPAVIAEARTHWAATRRESEGRGVSSLSR
ncbi:MAG: NAD-dependent epimerase/dehydratase family protein [Candidatus Schekmanbacteria bacterium]|nr:NAD-dependent epimerase/dehydratase family protein [Candidatus Schekmanbacteria bacterium]